MSLDIIEQTGIGLIHYRISKRLPLKTDEDRMYIKERFYWIVDPFKNQLFTSDNEILTDALFEQMFSVLEQGIPSLNLSNVYEFISGMGCSMVRAGGKLGMNLTVTYMFFSTLFYRIVDQRFHHQSAYISERIPYLCGVLEHAGIEKIKAHKIVEAGVIHSETSTKFFLPIEEFYFRIIEEIVKQCKAIGVEMDVKILTPDSYRKIDDEE
jgi:hypothetical protein